MGGTLGLALATSLVDALNLAGALLVTATALVIPLPGFELCTRCYPALVRSRRQCCAGRAGLASVARAQACRAVERARLRAARRALAAKNRRMRAQQKPKKQSRPRSPLSHGGCGRRGSPGNARDGQMDEPRFEAVAEIPSAR